MSCGCTPSSPTPSSSSGSSCAGSTPLPRRVTIGAIIPKIFSWLTGLRAHASGKLLVGCGEEMGALDSAVNGQVLFDAETQKVYVGTTAVNMVEDTVPCADAAVYGFPLYGMMPACRDMGQNPDRQIGTLRPPNSNTGTLFGHLTGCPTSPGLKPEVTPVEIVPATFPDEDPPVGLFSLGFTDVPAGENCTPATRKWWAVPQGDALAVDIEDMEEFDLPEGPLTEAMDEEFGLAIWVKNAESTKYKMQKVTNASFQALISAFQGSPFTFVRPSPLMHGQTHTGGAHWIPANVNYNLMTAAGYDEKYTAVMLNISVVAYTGTRSQAIYIQIDDITYAQVNLGVVNASDSDSACVIVPIPVTKQINIKSILYIDAPGTSKTASCFVFLSAFIR